MESKIPTSEWHHKIITEELSLKDPNRPLIKVRYEYLEDIINGHNYRKIVELGAGTGIPALYLLKNCPNIEEYIAVDPLWPASGSNQIPFPMADFLAARPGNRFIQSFAFEASTQIHDGTCDLVFLDHLAHIPAKPDVIKREVMAWIPKIRKNGIICGHDYCNPSHAHVVQALNEHFYPGGINLWLENHIYGGMNEMTDYFWWRYV